MKDIEKRERIMVNISSTFNMAFVIDEIYKHSEHYEYCIILWHDMISVTLFYLIKEVVQHPDAV